MYRSTPSIPVQAQFLKEVEVRLPDSQVHLLKPQAERQMLEAMKPLTTPLSFAVFLCLDERYTQGIVAGEVGCLAVWVKRLVLLGRWLGKRESEDSKREES